MRIKLEDFETFLKIKESRQEVDWLKPIFDKFLRELDSYFVKSTDGKWTIIRNENFPGGKPEENTVVMTSGSVSIYNFGEEDESWFLLEVVENKMFRVEITPIFKDPSSQDKPFTFSDFFNITYNAQGYKYLPSFQINRTFARTAGNTAGNRLKKSEVEKFYGEAVWFLTGGTTPPKRLKEEFDRILDMFKNAPVLDLSNYTGKLIGRKYGL